MNGYDVLVVGAGPTGLMLAGELKLAGVNVAIAERRTNDEVDGLRAGGLHARTIEILDQRGIAERFIEAGEKYPAVGFAGSSLTISDFPTRHNYLLALWQSTFEPMLAQWVRDLGVPIHYGNEVVGISQSEVDVTLELAEGAPLKARYVVGCDGGRSHIRKLMDIDFLGLAPTVSYIRAEVAMSKTPPFGLRPEGGGIGPAPDGTSYGVVVVENGTDHEGKPTLDELRTALIATYGTDYGLTSASWISRFTDATRQAATYRKGSVLLAGDAAHIHPPQSGQGLNTGVQDAFNLGWKLAQVVKGKSPESLLDTYETERRPIGERVLKNTRTQVLLSIPDERSGAAREIMTELLQMDEPRRHIAGMISGLDICYDLGGEHPLIGRRMPDIELETAKGKKHLFTLLHDAKPLLLLQTASTKNTARKLNHVNVVTATYDNATELPVIGDIDLPNALLIRPDGYVAWVGEPNDPGLPIAVETWFGTITA